MRVLVFCIFLLLFIALPRLSAQGDAAAVYAAQRDFTSGFPEWEAFYQFAYARIDQPLRVLPDPVGKQSRAEVLTTSPAEWRPAPELGLTDADTASVFWVRLSVEGDTSAAKTYLFQAGAGMKTWRRVDVYIATAAGDTLHKRTGLDVPPGERDVRDAFSFFTVPIPAGQRVELLLRLDGLPAGRVPAGVTLDHIDPRGLHEWNGYRLGGAYRRSYGSVFGRIVDYALRSPEILPEPPGGYRQSEIEQDSLWDHHARYNRWEGRPAEGVYWLRQRLIGDSLVSRYYTLLAGSGYGQTWTDIELYVPDERGRLTRLRSGLRTPPADKPVRDVHNLFRVYVPKGDTVTVYARLATVLPRLAPDNVFLSAFDYDTYRVRLSRMHYWTGLFQGALWIQLLYSLLLFAVSGERRELYYAVLVAGMQLFFISEPGYDFTLREWLPTRPEWWFGLLNLGSFVAIAGLLKFSQEFLELKAWWARGRDLINGLLLVLGLASVAVLFIRLTWAFQAWRLLTAAGLLLPFLLGCVALYRGRRPAGVFLAAATIFIAGAFSHLFSFILFPQGQGDLLTHIFFRIGVFLMLAMMALAMGFQNRQLRRDNEAALRENLLQQERLNHRLRQVDQMRDQFLANTSHELRTPLTGIIGLADSLADGSAGPLPEEAGRHLRMIAGSGRRLANLINDILDFARFKNQEYVLQRGRFDLRAVTDVVLTLLRPLAADKNLTLVNDVPAGLPPLYGDEDRVQQILFNLAGNAVKFTDQGEVRVGARLTGETGRIAEVYVRDTGAGIPANRQQTIFRAFEQGDGSTARTHSGTGLGLAITRQLVDLHGGHIRLESEAGKGSTFFFTLPLAGDDPASEGPLTAIAGAEEGDGIAAREAMAGQGAPEFGEFPSSPAAPGSTPALPAHAVEAPARILVVDDEPVNRQVLENQIRLAGYQVQSAASGEDALRMLHEGHDFDLVILDVMMPRLSGYEVCHRLRQHFLPSELPVILLTAKNRVSDLVQGFEAGANDYLTKPFLRDELLSRLRTHLNLGRISRASGRFVPHEFLQTLGKSNITDVHLGDYTQQEVTVLFSDIRDYTTLAEMMNPADNFRFVNAFAGRVGPIIREHGGFVQQYLGDAVMALFRKNPQTALEASIAMQHDTYAYNRSRAQKGRRPIRLGMGLHTGHLIMGIIGDQRRTEPATIADTVNVASRLEGLTKHYGANILLSEESHTRLTGAGAFHFRFLGPVQVKGKHQPVNVYECIDGDEPAIRDKKLQTMTTFRQALRHYFHREFAAAAAGFQETLAIHPHDATARLFLQKATGYLATGVPDDWTGVETMRYK